MTEWACWTRWSGRACRAEQLAEFVGLAWALGMALFSAVSFVFYLLGVPGAVAVGPALGLTIAGVAGGVAVLRAARRREGAGAAARQGDGAGDDDRGYLAAAIIVAGLVAVAVQMGLAVWIALHSLLRHADAWVTWGFAARMFALGGPPAGYFRSLAWSSHPNYPLNLPLVEALFFRLPDPLGLRLAALVGPACLAALLLLFYAGLARLYGHAMAVSGSAVLVMVPSLPRFAGLGYADVPVALYAGAAALYLVLWWRRGQLVDLVVMGLLAGAAVWTKREGLPLAVLLLLCCALREALRRDIVPRQRLAHIVWAGLATVALPLPWLVFTRAVHPAGTDFLPLTLGVFVHNVARLPHIALMLAQETLTVERWSLFWVLLAVLAACSVWRLSAGGRALLALLLAQLGVYAASYVFSDWVPYTLHVGSSLNRLLIQAVPLALLVMVEMIEPVAALVSTHLRALGLVGRVPRRVS